MTIHIIFNHSKMKFLKGKFYDFHFILEYHYQTHIFNNSLIKDSTHISFCHKFHLLAILRNFL